MPNSVPLRVLVAGNTNTELHVQTPVLPLPDAENTSYSDGLTLGVSGVGFNVAHALARLGAEAGLLTFAGTDTAGELVRSALARAGIRACVQHTPATPLSLVLSGADGQRQIHRDLKGTESLGIDAQAFQSALAGADVAVLTNVGWTRPLLPLARAASVQIVTDLQATPGPAHPYDQPFLAHADVLFLSAERLTLPPLDALRAYRERCDPGVIVISLGADGALMSERGQPPHHQPTVFTRPIITTNGAGDALLAAFVWAYFGGHAAWESLRLACTFASWKCGEMGGAAGHLSGKELSALCLTG
ncbi:carbohydrate kinase family protein [Deinococcus sp. Arct2-2]|uniref:carbohydrate kinase family protein n=1 Tax=Deinococcus sp. Arct2-2 TaxID=2568653 RepID=UPI0010A550E0|nr:carbohydrate kinase family protein [Deinococcus sp. Arct2-2]THF68641.1 carbohydrate kinase family protein [Deinococcus sp. Arct2-2]